MSVIKEQLLVEKITGFQCDLCQNTFESNQEYVDIQHTFGYNSTDDQGNSLDMSNVALTLCEPCFYNLLKRENLPGLVG